MQNIKFSTQTLLILASEVESAFSDQSEDRFFNLDRMQDLLNNKKVFSDRDRKIIYLCYERDMAFDEIVAVENVPTSTVRYTIDVAIKKLFCFSKVYRSKEYVAVNDIAVYKLLDEGDIYLHLFGNKTYYEVVEEFIRNDFKFKLDISRAHATIIALRLGFRGRELDYRYLKQVNHAAREKYSLYTLNFSDLEKYKDYDSVIRGQVDLRALQEYLDRAVGIKVKILEASGL